MLLLTPAISLAKESLLKMSEPSVPLAFTALNANFPSLDAVRRILSPPTANTSVRNILAIN